MIRILLQVSEKGDTVMKNKKPILFLGDVTFRRFKPHLDQYNIPSVLISYKYGNEYKLADKSYFFLEELSPEKIINIAKENQVQAVISRISPAVEETLVRDAIIKELIENELQIPVITHPIRAASITVDKGYTKHFLNAHNIPTPNGVVITGVDQLKEIARNFRFPCVLKHPTLANSQGVQLVRNFDELLPQYYKLGSQRVVLEEYIDGDEIGIEVIGQGSDFQVFPPSFLGTTSFECNPQKGIRVCPYIKETNIQQNIKNMALLIAKKLNICGLIEIDMIIRDNVVYVIDINARPGGVSGLSQASTSIDPYKELIDMALGKWKRKDITHRRFGMDLPINKINSLSIQKKLASSNLFIDLRSYISHDILTLSFRTKEELTFTLESLQIDSNYISYVLNYTEDLLKKLK